MAKRKINGEGVADENDYKDLLSKYRRAKNLKLPKKPKKGKKPSAKSSIDVINAFIEKEQAKMKYYRLQMKAYDEVKKEKEMAKEKLRKFNLALAN